MKPLTDAMVAVESKVEGDAYDLLAKYKREDGDWKSGVRPENVVETVKDIEWLLGDRRAKNGVHLTCGFCGCGRAVRSQSEGEGWFKRHPCDGEGVPIDEWLAA